MCKWGNNLEVEVTIPADLSYTRKKRTKKVGIDNCITSIVQALERGGVLMRASCCGHGKDVGKILLQDGRTLLIVPESK